MCRDWRQIFTSRPTLWTNLNFVDTDKTLAYLDRSRSSPIDVRLDMYEGLSSYDPFLQVIPHIIARLKSMVIRGFPVEDFQHITAQLSPHAPLLETLEIDVDCECSAQRGPVIATTLFNGDLSSLRKLRLDCIRTELPWRNMVNLTSFTLGYSSPGDSSVRHLLDFFESAPHLREIQLQFATPTFGTQTGRLVSLGHLKRMDISWGRPPSLLLDHLLVPTGAKFTMQVDSRGSLHLPESFDFLEEFSRFRIHLHVRGFYPSIQFNAPNCQISIVPATPPTTSNCRVFESLARFDPSNVKRLRLVEGGLMRHDGRDHVRILGRMEDLRALTISHCTGLPRFLPFFDGSGLCMKLEEFILEPRADREKFDIQNVIQLAAKRASLGKPLKSVRIVSWDKSMQASALKLREYVSHAECSHRVTLACGGADSDEEECLL